MLEHGDNVSLAIVWKFGILALTDVWFLKLDISKNIHRNNLSWNQNQI